MSTGITVKDAMVTGVITMGPDKTVLESAKIMKQNDIGSVVVCENNIPLGIATREDIINKVVADGKSPSDVLLKEIMSKNLIVCSPDCDISEAANQMSRYQYERIPVVSEGRLLGIISTREIAKVAPAALEIMTEHMRIENPEQMEEKEDETTEGICESCGNQADELFNVNDSWVCESCKQNV
ncbi:MAG: CBS domain-containing protein [Candidatus Aenigmarchaeota archaeon]|nr:CBS domain-containing protein [Candidatus Aenigmarchaeota archaeon]